MTDTVWTSDVLVHYPLISSVAVSPDGAKIAYTVRIAHMTDDASEYRHQLWLVENKPNSKPSLLAFGESAEQPQWSPDGQTIAFIRKGDSGKKGVWLLPVTGGEPWCITADEPVYGDVAALRWSPDGEQIALLAPPVDEEREKRTRARDDVQHWRVDFPFAQLFVQPVTAAAQPAKSPVQLTTVGRHVNKLMWSPDGSTIAFTHQANTLDDSWTTLRLATVASDGSSDELRDFGAVTNREGSPHFSPDGQWIACEAGVENNHWPYAGGIHLFSVTNGSARALATVPDEQPVLVGWEPDGSGVYAINQHSLATELFFLPADGSAASIVCAPKKLMTVRNLNDNGDFAVVLEDFHTRQAIYATQVSDADTKELSLVIAPLAEYPDGPLPQVKTLTWQSVDGFEIEGILYLPADYSPERDGKLPLLLHIHGGPMALFQRQFAATPYYYTPAAMCEQGIAMLRCNPRGSGGYGKEFRFANMKDWGGGDYQDIQKGVDKVIEMGVADPERLGIAGWSYGGFMTSWTITQTDRFKAASIGAAVTNPMTFCGTADLPSFIPDYFGGEFWEIPEFYQAHSPIYHLASVNTPSIIQHGGADARVPLEQGLQYYIALQRRGVPVDMYIYPRQGHAIDEPRLVMDAIQRNLDWFTEMLVDE